MFLVGIGSVFADSIIIEPDDSPHQLNYNLSSGEYSQLTQNGVALALSGGGARGLTRPAGQPRPSACLGSGDQACAGHDAGHLCGWGIHSRQDLGEQRVLGRQ